MDELLALMRTPPPNARRWSPVRVAIDPMGWRINAVAPPGPASLRSGARRPTAPDGARKSRRPEVRQSGHRRFPRGRGRKGPTRSVGSGGDQPAIIRTHSRARTLATPGKCFRSSMTADSSPSCSNTRRIAAAAASSTTNIIRTMTAVRARGKRDRCAARQPVCVFMVPAGVLQSVGQQCRLDIRCRPPQMPYWTAAAGVAVWGRCHLFTRY